MKKLHLKPEEKVLLETGHQNCKNRKKSNQIKAILKNESGGSIKSFKGIEKAGINNASGKTYLYPSRLDERDQNLQMVGSYGYTYCLKS